MDTYTPRQSSLPARSSRWLLSLCALALVTSPLCGQAASAGASSAQTKPNADAATATVAPDESPVVLSPFEVTSTNDVGYAASNTLAGNRINTNLRDVGSAISVYNQQFLKDLGAFNNETLLQYATGAEVGGIYGNMSGANGVQSTQLDETSKFVAPNTNTRLRGLAVADNTIDFFLTDIPWDGYNIDRIDIQRGPNAILFGLGQPGGIVNASTRQADLRRTHGSVEARYSSFDSLRTTLDLNYALVPKQVALRLDLLRNNEKFKQKPAYQRDERLYGAIRIEPAFLNKSGFARTTLRANFENGHVHSNRPRSVPPGDSTSPWFQTGTVAGFLSNGTPQTYNNLARLGFDARGLQDGNIANTLNPDRGQFVQNVTPVGGATQLNPYWQPWLGGQFAAGYFGNPMAMYEGGASVRYANWEPTTIRGINSSGAIDQNIGGIPFSRMSSVTGYRDYSRKINLPGAKFGLTRNQVMTDPTIFDFYNQLIDGPNKKEWQNFRRFSVTLSQTAFNGDIAVEASIDRQRYDNGQLVLMTDKAQTIFVDVIKTMADGTVNPNFGRPFIADSIGNNRVTFIDRSSDRLTGVLQHEFDRGNNRDHFWAKLIGKQSLTGLFNRDERESDTRGFMRWSTDLAYKDFVFGPSTAINIDDSRRAIYPVIYLGPSLANSTSAAGAQIQAPQFEMQAPSGAVRVFDSTWAPAAGVNPGDVWTNPDYPVGNSRRTSTQSENPANYKGWGNIPLTTIDWTTNRDALTTNAQLTKTQVSSKALVWNGYLWNRALVGMVGWRHDTSKAWSYTGVRLPSGPSSNGSINLDSNTYRLPAAYRDRIDESSKSWSIVAHLTQLAPKLQVPFDLSLFYSKSENFAATAGRVGPLNDPLGPPRGLTKDAGFTIGTKDGKYSLRVNRFDSRSERASTGAFNSFYLWQFFTDYHPWFNVFKYKIDTNNSFDLSGPLGQNPTRWQWTAAAGQTDQQAQADEAAAITAWEKMIAAVPKDFFSAAKINIDTVDRLTSTAPAGNTITESNVSKGYEIELQAKPTRSLRLTANLSKAEAQRSNIGPDSLVSLVDVINTALNTTPAGLMRNSAAGTATTALTNWNNNFYAQYAPVKFSESVAVPELRKYHANLVANYDFRSGFLKDVSVGGAYRWMSRVVIGYRPIFLDFSGKPAANPQVATLWRPDYDSPFYGPSEGYLDLWVGYRRQISKKLAWRTQLNVRNVGRGNYLIPINVQPDGTPVGYRIGATQTWSFSNTLEF